MDRFEGKTAIITGGGGDLGRASAKRLLSEGAFVILTDYFEEGLKEATDEMASLGYGTNRVKTITGDVRILRDCENVAQYTKEVFGRVDVLITSAGILRHTAVDDMEEKDWKDVIDINLTGTFHSVKSVVEAMKEQKSGRIVLVSSLGGRTGRPGVGVNYAASKAGIVGMTMALGYELGPWNITVNCIAPGPLKGKMYQSQTPETIQRLRRGIRLERLGELSEVAAGIAFLASDDASWATGEVLDYNGGLQY